MTRTTSCPRVSKVSTRQCLSCVLAADAVKRVDQASRRPEPIRLAQHRRPPRHCFVARVELIDLDSEARLVAQTSNLNLNGCFVETSTPFPAGSKVRLRILHGSMAIAAVCRVAYSEPRGMGIGFIKLEPGGEVILDKWITSLRK